MGKSLVIVESPAKARTIAGYLGGEYAVESSIGHVRDLPNRASEVPDAKRKQFGALGVDVEQGFEPYYVVDPGKKKVVTALKKKLADADELLLATDEDREGEAIAWHLVEVLKPKVPVRRMVFHEITREAISRALGETRSIDQRLVDAQETRRILDRLYGYEVSPVLWKKVTRGLSAGRVQSVATRLVVERERERIAFVSAGYWDLIATFDPGSFEARLVAVGGSRVAQGRDFAPDGTLRDESLVRLDEERARALAASLEGAAFRVSSVDEKPYRRQSGRSVPHRDAPAGGEPEAALLGPDDDARRPAAVRVGLHHVHAHRLDDALRVGARGRSRAGANPVRSRLRSCQAAPVRARGRERPGGARGDPPGRRHVPRATGREGRARPGRARALRPHLEADPRVADGGRTRADGLAPHRRDRVRRDERGVRRLRHRDHVPRLPRRLRARPRRAGGRGRRGAPAAAARGRPGGHPAVARGRGPRDDASAALHGAHAREGARGPRHRAPSTYAAILSTIVDRGYVFKKGTALVPTFVAFAVVNLLEQHFGQLVDFDFTARMEDDLDRIAAGDEERVDWLRRFYFGDGGDPGLHHLVTDHLDEIDARAVNSIAIPGTEAVIRVGRYGPYVERGEQRATLPADLAPDELTAEKAEELLSRPESRSLGTDPETGHEITVRSGRYGPYVTEVLPEESEEKPRTGSLFASMSPETVSLEEALRLLSLPRVLGIIDDVEVTAQNGRYGPYVKKGSESRSLESEEQLFTVTLEDAARSSPSRRDGAGGTPPAARCESSAPIPPPAGRSCSATAASGRTSPTARRTRACARATRWRAHPRAGLRAPRGKAR